MRDFTTVGIGGPADRILFPASGREVAAVLASERAAGRTVLALGAGSNLLVSDRGVRATVVCLKRNLGKVLFSTGRSVVADAGTMLPRFAVLCALSGMSGAEEISGIPGTVGGGLLMNAGAYGREIGELVEWVEVATGEGSLVRAGAREIRFGYREAVLPAEGIVVRAGFRMRAGTPDGVFARMKELNERRRATQPWGERTFGSVFRNPPGAPAAGILLERAGMKGAREGDAAFSEKHANFLVNRGRATAADAARLIARAKRAVRETAGITLVPEVRTWGDIHV